MDLIEKIAKDANDAGVSYMEHIAKVCHEVNRAYCISIGDNSHPSWEDAPEWLKGTIINGVSFHTENPDTGPEALHESWMKEKEADGWKYGPLKNVELKEHPCFVQYEHLPIHQKAKDHIFKEICKQLI